MPAPEPTRRIRVGMVGAGTWAGMLHVPALASHPEVELVGIWNHRPELARALAEAHDTRAFSDLGEMLARVDAVSFAVPPAVQPALALQAAAAGRHLLLEKPIALTVAEGEALTAAVARGGLASVVFFTRRFDADSAAALAAIAGERRWEGVTGRMCSGAMLTGTPFADCLWRQQKGALWDIGPHALSVVLAALGQVVTVEASRPEPQLTRLRMTHAGGACSDISLSLHAAPPAQVHFYDFRAGAHTTRLEMVPGAREAAFHAAIDRLIGAIRTGRPHDCDVRLGLKVLRVLVAAETSLERDQAVAVGG